MWGIRPIQVSLLKVKAQHLHSATQGLQLLRRCSVTNRVAVQPIGCRLSPHTRACRQTATRSFGLPFNVLHPEIHVITWITTYLPTPKGWKAELVWLVDPQLKWSHVSHRSVESLPVRDQRSNHWTMPPTIVEAFLLSQKCCSAERFWLQYNCFTFVEPFCRQVWILLYSQHCSAVLRLERFIVVCLFADMWRWNHKNKIKTHTIHGKKTLYRHLLKQYSIH